MSTPSTSDTVGDLAIATISEVVDEARILAEDQYGKIVALIRRNPIPAVGIAAVAGFALVSLLRSPSR